jgi:hypothetical protein
MQVYFERTFPTLFTSLTKKVIGDLSLLLTWQGRDSTLNPILLMAHQNVVPVSQGTKGNWIQPPFSGNIIDGYTRGRGTLVTGLYLNLAPRIDLADTILKLNVFEKGMLCLRN